MLEHRYGATLLAALLTGEPVDLLDTPFVLSRVTFQDRLCPVDDVVIEGTAAGGDHRVVAVAVRRNPIIADRNPKFLALLAGFLQVVRDRPDDLHDGTLRLGLAVADPHSGARELRSLTDLARDRVSGASFWAAIDAGDVAARERRRCRGLLAAVAAVGELPAAADGPTGELVWELLRVLYVLLLRVEGDVQPDWTRWAASLARCTSDASEADRLLGYLYELTGRKAPGGAEITRESLRQQLTGRFTLIDESGERIRTSVGRRDGSTSSGELSRVTSPCEVWPLVRHVDPRDLGVHPAIVVPGAADWQPAYVARAVDDQLRVVLRAGKASGCFVVLLGGSCVGKTRAAFEAVLNVTPDWQLFHPVDSHEVIAFAADPKPHTVLWLDEMHNYLGGAGGITAGTMRSLHRSDAAVIVIGTVWPDKYVAYTSLPVGDEDPYAGERGLLRLADVVDVPVALSGPERAQAEAVAVGDPRIRVALDSADYGMTQVLAAAPYLVRRWENAPTSEAAAVITAAADARRMGIHRAVPAPLLRDATSGYLSAAERATLAPDWFDTALRYATQRLHGATSALSALADPSGRVVGYGVADYLVQRGAHTRRAAVPPDSFWRACAAHVDDPSELFRLGMAAEQRGLVQTAEELWRRACRAGDANARDQLVRLLCDEGRVDDAKAVLTGAIDRGDADARRRLAALLGRNGELAEAAALWRSIAFSDPTAFLPLAAVLERDNQPDAAIAAWELAAKAGVADAVRHLADLLERHARIDEAIELLRGAGANGSAHAWDWLVQLLRRNGRMPEIEQARRQALAAGAPGAFGRLVRMLHTQDRHSEIDAVLRQAVRDGRRGARAWLARRLELQGAVVDAERTLRDAVDDGEVSVRLELEGFLSRHRPEEAEERLRQRTAEGDFHARHQLAEHLARRGEFNHLIRFWEGQADAGDADSLCNLAHVYQRTGRVEEAFEVLGQLADAMPGSSWRTRSKIAELHEQRGEITQAITAWQRATAEGEEDAWANLAWLLVQHDRDDEAEQILRKADAAEQPGALHELAYFLASHGGLTEVEALWRQAARTGDHANADQLIEVLLEHDQTRRAEELLRRAASRADRRARIQLAGLLERLERTDEAIEVWRQAADSGDQYARDQLVDLLEQERRLDEAITIRRAAVDAGERDARQHLVRLLERCGYIDQAADVWREGAAAGEPGAYSRLAGLLDRYGRHAEAAQAWSHAVDAGEILARKGIVRDPLR
ncbi:hypothetical protein I0C86_09240 [Plantactinospora sp. S1510]|uniref:Tetratricopeptide repeat protein n=1 Tax=Plantactinospora alkalitolerans TaxID=2789879 RepID=A0ABS0GT22_9ACTN|nr:hypothetical protein [Plantactinospora alkalitolerans]MBF9129159.1 hypothetical protein [Plantactinospora alkalitolerans]